MRIRSCLFSPSSTSNRAGVGDGSLTDTTHHKPFQQHLTKGRILRATSTKFQRLFIHHFFQHFPRQIFRSKRFIPSSFLPLFNSAVSILCQSFVCSRQMPTTSDWKQTINNSPDRRQRSIYKQILWVDFRFPDNVIPLLSLLRSSSHSPIYLPSPKL